MRRIVGLVAVIAVVGIGCSSSAGSIAVTTTTSTATTTPQVAAEQGITTTSLYVEEPIDPDKCSTTWLDEPLELREESYVGLPQDVAAVRAMLIDAAANCNFESFMANANLPSPAREAFLGYAGADFTGVAPYERLVRDDSRSGGNLRSLLLALTTVPYGVETVTVESNEGDEEVSYYVWPPQPELRTSDGDVLPATEAWSRDLADRIGVITQVSGPDVYSFTDQFGSYILRAVAIEANGSDWFLFSGDRNNP